MSDDWRETILREIGRVDHRQSMRNNGYLLQFHAPPEVIYSVDMACRRLDITKAAYMRRISAICSSRWSGIDPVEQLADAPPPLPYGTTRKPGRGNDPCDNLHLYCPHPGCDGAHLR